MDFVKQLLDNSPFIFGVGQFKYDFFKSFMKYNLGVSEGCPWKQRRIFNEHVLSTDIFSSSYNNSIKEILLKHGLPKTGKEFDNIGQLVAMKIVFNENEIYKPLFNVISSANSIDAVVDRSANIPETEISKYNDYIRKHINNPKENSLMFLTQNSDLTEEEILHQVPHWIFPINGAVTNISVRLLLLLSNHPEILSKVKQEISNTKTIGDLHYLRKCVLETCRLNNPVNSTFRTLLKDYSFDKQYSFKKGDQFLVLNGPILRESKAFPQPNKFIPERWNPKLEKSYYAIMFNQGPQMCPGKELAIFIIKSFVVNYLCLSPELKTNKIETNYIPQMINTCNILFS